jgi:hypothetical protein
MKSWSFIAKQLKGRLGKQCRERWYNHLNPDINRAPWSTEEDALIIEVRGFTHDCSMACLVLSRSIVMSGGDG